MKKRKRRANRKAIKYMQLSPEILLDLPKLSITGRDELFLENHKGLIEYSKYIVRAETSIGIIQLAGRDFELIEMSSDCIIVYGEIESLVFIGEGMN